MRGQTVIQCGMVLLCTLFIAGCSSPSVSASSRSNECIWNRSGCMYEGSYESGERIYAEEEAKRLNRAASARLRRSAIR